MITQLRTRTTAIWAVLIVATIASWLLGTDHGLGMSSAWASVVILLVAFFKIRLVGLYFMELRDAPAVLRALLEGYCAAVCAVLVGLFLFA